MFNFFLSKFASDVTIGASCPLQKSSFLSFPTWYSYLPGKFAFGPGVSPETYTTFPPKPPIVVPSTAAICSPTISGLSDIWLIVAAIVEILLQIAAMAAIAMIIYGGVQYVLSRGQPDKAQQARSTIINAVIGLVLAVTAAALVTFVAGRFS